MDISQRDTECIPMPPGLRGGRLGAGAGVAAAGMRMSGGSKQGQGLADCTGICHSVPSSRTARRAICGRASSPLPARSAHADIVVLHLASPNGFQNHQHTATSSLSVLVQSYRRLYSVCYGAGPQKVMHEGATTRTLGPGVGS